MLALPPRFARSAWLFLLGGAGSAIAAPPASAPPAYPEHANLMVVRDASGQERPVTTPADWEVRRGHILAHLQEVMGPLPERKRGPVDFEVLMTRQEPGYLLEKISIASEPGDRVPAWLLTPDAIARSKRRGPAI